MSDSEIPCLPPGPPPPFPREEAIQIILDAAESLHDRFPPPLPTAFDPFKHTMRAAIAGHDPEEIFADVLAAIPDTPYRGHYEAIFAVSLSILDHSKWPWETTLVTIAEKWPNWGVPWLRAARQILKKSTLGPAEFELARNYLISAARYLPIGNPSLLKHLDQLRRRCDRRIQEQKNYEAQRNSPEFKAVERVLFDVAELLSRHEPTVRNYSRVIETFWRADQHNRAHAAIARFLDLHGKDPANWPVQERYDELSAAGALCHSFNMAAAAQHKHHGEHSYRSWNDVAINFLQRSLEAPGADGGTTERVYALIRLCETYAHTLRYVAPNISDEEYQATAERAIDAILHLGSTFPTQQFTAQRHLTMIYRGAARRARALGKPQEEIDRWVDKAENGFISQLYMAKPQRRPRLRMLRAEFLAEFERYAEAIRASTDAEEGDIVEVASLYRKGSRRQAVKKLVDLTLEAKPPNLIGYAVLLVHYLRQTEARARIPKELHDRAMEVLKPVIGLLMHEASEAVNDGDAVRARRRLEVIDYVEGVTDPRIAHVYARVGLLEIEQGTRSAASVLAELENTFDMSPWLRDEPYLTTIYLKVLAREPSVEADADVVWQLAGGSNISLQSENVMLYHALQWLIGGNRGEWWKRLLEVARLFPSNRSFVRLTSFAWQRHGIRAVDGILAALHDSLALVGLPWLRDAISDMPGDFFASEETIRAFSQWISISDEFVPIAGPFVRGLARAQIAAANDRNEQWRRIRRSASAIDELRRQSTSFARWRDWLGGERWAIRRIAFDFAARTVESLNRTLVKSGERDRDTWERTLTEFIAGNRSDREERRADAQTDLVQFCVKSTENYDPSEPDRSYYAVLGSLIDKVLDEAEHDDVAQTMAKVWQEMFLAVGLAILRSIADPAVGPVHRFKNDLLASGHGPELSNEEIRRFEGMTQRIIRFLDSYSAPNITEVNINAVLRNAVFRPPVTPSTIDRSERPAVYAVTQRGAVYVRGDADMLMEAISALIENAYRFTLKADHHRWVWCEVRREGSDAIIEITDSGLGAEAARVAHLNDARASMIGSASDSTGYGTRLGHRVAALLGGTLKFASAGPGTGMNVRFSLPMAREE